MSFPAEQFPVETVREIARLLESADLSEISLENAAHSSRLTLRRSAPTFYPSAETFGEEFSDDSPDEISSTDENAIPTTLTVVSPCVGVLRLASAELVVGAAVKAKQLLGVVEALKIPNEIYAPAAGKIVALPVQEGQGVEWGQLLVEIEPEAA